MILRRLEELDDVAVHRPDGRGRGPHCAGPQLGLAGQPVQEVERRNAGAGWYQATNLRELLDDRFVLFDKLVQGDIVVTFIIQPSQKFGFLSWAVGRN